MISPAVTENSVKLILPSKSVNEGFVRSVTAAFAAQADPTCDLLADIKTAVSEAVTNCIVHAYPDSIGDIYITAKLIVKGGKKVFWIKIADRGRGIPDLELAMQPLYTSAGGERSGLGFTMMQSFMDEVRVRSKQGQGTSVLMKKTLSDRNAL